MGRAKSRGIGIQEVAKAAGVSTATVSYVLNGRGHVSPATAERVREAIERLHYQPNQAGRALATDSAQAIGLVGPRATGVADPFFSRFLAGVLEASRESGHRLVLLAPEDSPEGTVDAVLQAVRSKQVDGVILLEVEPDDIRVDRLAGLGIPCALFGRTSLNVPWVDVDNEAGGFAATRALIAQGHSRIAHIAAPQRYQYARLRRAGYEQALREANIPPQVVEGDLTVQGGAVLTRELLTRGAPPTAIFAASDMMAEGALRAAQELGVQVPQQLSVIGFDDSPLAQETVPRLSTVAQDPYPIGQRVVRLLLARIRDGKADQELIQPRLELRGTTAPAASGVGVPRVGGGILLKAGEAFLWLSPEGQVDPAAGGHGVYYRDTHWLNLYQVRADGLPLDPLVVRKEADRATFEYVVARDGGSWRLRRVIALAEDHFDDEWTWESYGVEGSLGLEIQVAPDFRDVFEMRQMANETHDPVDSWVGDREYHRYRGKDGVTRELTIRCHPSASSHRLGQIQFAVGAGEPAARLLLSVGWREHPIRRAPPAPSGRGAPWPRIETNRPGWNRVFDRSRHDLAMLATDYGRGPVFSAGLPWYATLFGRDAAISAYQLLALAPQWAVRTLDTLAMLQGTRIDAQTEEMPGKMVHEMRQGELTNSGRLPFGRYYGSVDVTPLYLILLVETWRRTGDASLVERHWHHAEGALSWLRTVERRGGLFMFRPTAPGGLAIQSWKDSPDSMVYEDGRRAGPPLAVAEVQGYCYRALVGMAGLFRAWDRNREAADLEAEAQALAADFEAAFWLPDRGYYALAVDADGEPLKVLSSDMGQCLWAGIIAPEHRPAVVRQLLDPALFSGWGIRTLGALERAYDPFSYHRGSVWPHDTSLIAEGIGACGDVRAASRVAAGLMGAGSEFPDARMPELFAGLGRDVGYPVPCPNACAPQAWAAAAPWLLVKAVLGLDIDAVARQVRLHRLVGLGDLRIRIAGIPLTGERTVEIRADRRHAVVEGLPADWRMVTHAVRSPGREVVGPA